MSTKTTPKPAGKAAPKSDTKALTPQQVAASKTPEQEAADKAAIAKAKAAQAEKDKAAKAEAAAKKAAEKEAAAKAKAEAKEAAAKAKADEIAAKRAEQAKLREEAAEQIAALTALVEMAAKNLADAKEELRAYKAQHGFSAAAGGASTDALRQKAATYVHDKTVKTAGGNTSVDNGDAIAARLRGATLDAVYAGAAEVLEENEADLRAKYAHLNIGMQRMNLGNRIRAAINAK